MQPPTAVPGERLTGPARAAWSKYLADRYRDTGCSIRELAKQTNWSYGFVHRILTESGVTLRPCGGPRSRWRQQLTPHQPTRPGNSD